MQVPVPWRGSLLALLCLLCACTALAPAPKDVQRDFTFDYSVAGRTQLELWRSARDFFAEQYGDSRAVFRVLDEQEGTAIGQALASWTLAGNDCKTAYHIRFASKD